MNSQTHPFRRNPGAIGPHLRRFALLAAAAAALAGMPARAQVDPLRQVGATTAKPNVLLILDASRSMSAPMNASTENQRLYADNVGGWRFLRDSNTFPYGDSKAEMCNAGAGEVCAGYAWYEPARFATMKSVLGDSMSIFTLRERGYCGFDSANPASPYSCAERTNYKTATTFLTDFSAPFILDDGSLAKSNSYTTLLCVSDAHDVGHGTAKGEVVGDPDAGSTLVALGDTLDDGSRWVYSGDFWRPGNSSLWHVSKTCAPAGANGSASSFRYGLSANCASFNTSDLRNGGWLVSPSFTSSSGKTARLSLWSRRRTEVGGCSTSYDRTAIYIRAGKPTAAQLVNPGFASSFPPPATVNGWYFVGEICDESGAWTFHQFDISAQLAVIGQADIYLGFVFDTIDDVSNDYLGWMVDEIQYNDEAVTLEQESAGQASAMDISTGGGSITVDLVPAFTLAPAVNSASVEFTLGGAKANDIKSCFQVKLVAPDGSEYTLKDFGEAVASPYDVTATYNAESVGTWRLKLSAAANSGACKGVSVSLTGGSMTLTKGGVDAGGDLVLQHPAWNGNPCSFYSDPRQSISSDIETSLVPDNLSRVRRDPKKILTVASQTMNLGLFIYSNQISKAINSSDLYFTSGQDAVDNSNSFANLVQINQDDEDDAGRQFNLDRINAYFRVADVRTSLTDPVSGKAVDVYGLNTSDQPTAPFNNKLATDIVASLTADSRVPCRKSYAILIVDSAFSSGSGGGCKGQAQLYQTSIQTMLDADIKTFVVQFGPGGRRYNANLLAYTGRTDADDPDQLAGLDWVPGDGSELDQPFANSHGASCDACDDVCTAAGQHNFAYFAETADELAAAIEAILAAIAAGDYVTAPPSVSPTTGGVAGEGFKFLAMLSSAQFPGWKGHLRAADLTRVRENEDGTGDCVDITPQNEKNPFCDIWDAGALLAARDLDDKPREIWTANPSTKAMIKVEAANAALIRALSNYDSGGGGALTAGATNCEAGADARVNINEFLDFVHGYDGKGTGTQRPWILGDSVNIVPVLVDKPIRYGLKIGDALTTLGGKPDFDELYETRHPIIYMPANDGMLHLFDAIDGFEVSAFLVPSQIRNVAAMYCNFKQAYEDALLKGKTINDVINPTGQRPYTDPLGHIYTLSSSPRITDITVETAPDNFEWRTVLMLGEGAGGDSYYALDVTHPYPGRTGVCDYIKDENCGITADFGADPNYSAAPPFSLLWSVNNETKGFEGIGETWGIFPVGLLDDPNSEKGVRKFWGVAFGSYHGTRKSVVPENERTTEAAKNSYWVVRADTGTLLKQFNPNPAHLADFLNPPSYAINNPAKPNIPNGTFADTVMMSTNFELNRHWPDAPVTRLFQADLQGRLWLANIAPSYYKVCENPDDDPLSCNCVDITDDNSTNPPCTTLTPPDFADWPSAWTHYARVNPTSAKSCTETIEGPCHLVVTYSKPVAGNPSSVGAVVGPQPIHYTPAVGHLSEFRYVVAYSTGGWLETNSMVAGSGFPAHLVLLVLDKTIDNKLCQSWVARLPEIELVVTDPVTGQKVPLLDANGNEVRLSSRARVTGPPLMVIRKPLEDSTLPTRGTVFFTVYDPGIIDNSTGFCVGTSYAVLLDFEHEIIDQLTGLPFAECESGSATAQIIQIGIGFITMTAGPHSPILALTGIGKNAPAKITTGEGGFEPPPSTNMSVVSWREMDCRY